MENRFHKSVTDKKFGGVCAGIAETLNLDITIVRIAAFFLCLLYPTSIIVYLILAVVLPTELEINDSSNAPSLPKKTYNIKPTFYRSVVVGLLGAIIGGAIYKIFFLLDVTFFDLLGFMTLAIGLYLLIGGLNEVSDKNVKITKISLGSVITFTAVTKMIRLGNLIFLPVDYLLHSISYLWPILILCLCVTLVVPKKKAAITIWLIAVVIVLLYTFVRLIALIF